MLVGLAENRLEVIGLEPHVVKDVELVHKSGSRHAEVSAVLDGTSGVDLEADLGVRGKKIGVGVEDSVDGVVGLGVRLGFDNNGVSLSGGDVDLLGVGRLRVDTINLDNCEQMAIDAEDHVGESGQVDNAELVLLSGNELVGGTLAIIDQAGLGERRPALYVRVIEELLEEDRAFLVVPIFCQRVVSDGSR